MGLRMILSSSCHTNCKEEIIGKNPDPSRFKIIKTYLGKYENELYSIFYVNYENCTNYEGNKILVFYGLREDKVELMETKTLDPHFCESVSSPIMRVNPSDKGWRLVESIFNFKRNEQ